MTRMTLNRRTLLGSAAALATSALTPRPLFAQAARNAAAPAAPLPSRRELLIRGASAEVANAAALPSSRRRFNVMWIMCLASPRLFGAIEHKGSRHPLHSPRKHAMAAFIQGRRACRIV